MLATMTGMKIVMTKKWDVDEGMKISKWRSFNLTSCPAVKYGLFCPFKITY